MTPEGLIVCGSKFGPKETMDRLAAAETTRGISIMRVLITLPRRP